MSQTKITVIGAGVIGLTTALSLKQDGYENVKVVARHLPGDINIQYTSPYAGAHWRTMAPNDNPMLQGLDETSYKKFLKIADMNKSIDTGIMIVPSFDYFEKLVPLYTNPWYKDVVKDFRFLSEKDGLPKGAKMGHFYTTVLVNSPVYLKWLELKFKELGGTIERKVIRNLKEFASENEDIDVLINCTGLGARYLGGVQDKAMYPTRGQTVVIKANHIKRTMTFIGDHGITYIIPRSDGTVILGGTHDNDSNPFPDESSTCDILKLTKELCPELSEKGELEIVSFNVGLRPTRKGGPRFENEMIRAKNGRKVLITHAYGHDGFGVQSSWGSAEYTINLMKKGINKMNESKL
ncbi:hypothetical protein CU098_003470 [Rhizopus stolonifer]|uniref:FAD dependent oxidoreductase domain-containing protein n=1 Tax=Rhizopus stolonifer TaxID=4846 RepID=A0A367IQ82_RHIST|nr:hypothetical protein CU098_003470 [Rhizopus stolonifer]